jgi:hypothetical protein
MALKSTASLASLGSQTVSQQANNPQGRFTLYLLDPDEVYLTDYSALLYVDGPLAFWPQLHISSGYLL